jgi:CO dehydrogenase/acetyl-CoA synthase beta subunit
VREFVAARPEAQERVFDEASRAQMATRFSLAPRGLGKPDVILADDVAAELGHPAVSSLSATITTQQRDAVVDGRVTLIGPNIGELTASARRPFAQFVLLELAADAAPDPFDLENAQQLANRLPGYMVRSVPGRRWARFSKEGRARGLDLFAVGALLIHVYRAEFVGVRAAEALSVTTADRDLQQLAPIAAEAKVLAGRHKKLTLGLDGEAECSDLDCEICDEKPVCDNLRDIVIKRRSRRHE